MVTILMISTKLATLDLPEIKLLWNNGYEVVNFFHDVSDKILSRDSNYIVDVIMWPKFGNSSVSMTEVIIASIL